MKERADDLRLGLIHSQVVLDPNPKRLILAQWVLRCAIPALMSPYKFVRVEVGSVGRKKM
jgi:hypothetical protein